MSNRNDDEDDQRDDPEVDADILIEELEHSRKLVSVAEYDVHLVEDDVRAVQKASHKEVYDLEDRKRLAELAILACQDNNNNFLPNMFLRYGRTEKESQAYRYATTQRIKDSLRRKIFLKHRRADLAKHKKIMCDKLLTKNHEQYKEVENILEGKKLAGDIMFRTNITNANLKRIARQTRELVQGINSLMAFMDIIQDMAGKFGRITDYLYEDHVHFSRVLDDLQDKIKLQQTEIDYLHHVFKDSKTAADRAEKACNGSAADIKYAKAVRDKILQELESMLLDYKEIHNGCIKGMVEMNQNFANASDGCMKACPLLVSKYPFIACPPDSLETPKRVSEFYRCYELMKDLTQARDPQELVEAFRSQVDKARELQSTTDRLEALLTTVLRPESDMYAKELDFSSAQFDNRRVAAEATATTLQDEFDVKIEAARAEVSDQRANKFEYEAFVEILYAFNERIGMTYHTFDEDQAFLTANPTTEGLFEVTAKNTKFAAEKLAKLFDSDWNSLKRSIENTDFLEYRASKLPKNNNRQTYDLAVSDRPEVESPEMDLKFITRAQFKDANQRIQERARQAEIARLKEAAEKAEHENKEASVRDQ